MGVMTVASPTTGVPLVPLAHAPRIEFPPAESARLRVTCQTCLSAADSSEPFCAHCGSRVVLATSAGRPADVAATRSLQFGLLVVVANLLIGGGAFGVVLLVSDAARFTDAALALEVLKFLVVGSLAVVAIRYGVRGVRATADGRLARRRWAIAGIGIGGLFGTLVTLSLIATVLMTVLL
jgi:hypothetical protein